jgi:hypothetical protein
MQSDMLAASIASYQRVIASLLKKARGACEAIVQEESNVIEESKQVQSLMSKIRATPKSLMTPRLRCAAQTPSIARLASLVRCALELCCALCPSRSLNPLPEKPSYRLPVGHCLLTRSHRHSGQGTNGSAAGAGQPGELDNLCIVGYYAQGWPCGTCVRIQTGTCCEFSSVPAGENTLSFSRCHAQAKDAKLEEMGGARGGDFSETSFAWPTKARGSQLLSGSPGSAGWRGAAPQLADPHAGSGGL